MKERKEKYLYFAGKGSKTSFRRAHVNAERYGNDNADWSHVKGIAKIENEYESGTAEIHWVESEETGMIDPFVKNGYESKIYRVL